MKDRVLIGDDIEINRLILREILEDKYEVEEAADGFEAVQRLTDMAKPSPHAVLLDIMMPGMDGFDVLKVIKSNPHTEKIPVLFITAADANTNETRGILEGAVDYISKPFNPDVVKARLGNHIQLMRYQSDLESLVEKKTADLTRTHEQLMETMATIIEYRSLESGTHIRRTVGLTRIIIEKMLPMPKYRDYLIKNNYNAMIKAVALHDVGKVGIPDSILLKAGRLTPEEYDKIKEHTTIGHKIIKSISSDVTDDGMYLKHCMDICRYHHEFWDGRGYPDKLKGEEIPLSARIVAVVDVYDALVTPRCYKDPMTNEQAVDIIKKESGTHFDPDIVEVFLQVVEKFEQLEAEQTTLEAARGNG